MKSEPEEIIESMFHINHDIKFDSLKDESLDIDLSVCVPLGLERSSGATLLDLYLSNDESIDYGTNSSLVTEFLMPAIPRPPSQPPPVPFYVTTNVVASSMISQVKDVESRKNKRKLSQPKRADSHVTSEDESNAEDGKIFFILFL